MQLTHLSGLKGSNCYKNVEKAYNSRIESETGKSYLVISRNIKQTVLNHWSTIISYRYILQLIEKKVHYDTTLFQLCKLIARIIYGNDSKLPRPILKGIIKMNE